jgi:hypothetical protein
MGRGGTSEIFYGAESAGSSRSQTEERLRKRLGVATKVVGGFAESGAVGLLLIRDYAKHLSALDRATLQSEEGPKQAQAQAGADAFERAARLANGGKAGELSEHSRHQVTASLALIGTLDAAMAASPSLADAIEAEDNEVVFKILKDAYPPDAEKPGFESVFNLSAFGRTRKLWADYRLRWS